jgi:hypothetical protein
MTPIKAFHKAFSILLLPYIFAIAPVSTGLANQPIVSHPIVADATPIAAPQKRSDRPTQRLQKQLLNTVARQFRVPLGQLKVQAVQHREWNGCLGVVNGPQTACTMNVIPGWQMVVSTRDRDWVYHTDSTGQKIVYNSTASRPEVDRVNMRAAASLIATQDLPEIEANVIFRVTTASYATNGEVISTVLTNDGVLTRYRSSPTIRTRPVVLKRLTPNEVTKFQTLIRAQNISNLNGLYYPPIAQTASGESVTYQSLMGGVVRIGAPEISPAALNRISEAWSYLVQP